MYVVVVGDVVDGFEEALELARGSSVNHKDKCYPHWFGWKVLSRILIPLDVHISFTCTGLQTAVYIFIYQSTKFIFIGEIQGLCFIQSKFPAPHKRRRTINYIF